MDLWLLDNNFQICGIVDDFSSLVWNRKYYDCGNFCLQTDLKDLDKFQNAKYLYRSEAEEIGVFETLDFKHPQTGIQILRTGRFLESKLAQRVIMPTQKFNKKTTEEISFGLVDSQAISSSEDRVINRLTLGELKGLGNKRTLQTTGKNLMEKLYQICKDDELSIRLKYDFDTGKMIFTVWQGLDRTDSQSENGWAIFARNFENILEDEYSTDNSQFCNYAYVEGEAGDYDNPQRVEVIIDNVKEGEERRELYVDARDLQKDDDMTDEEYLESLKERGIEKLAGNIKVETSDFAIDPLSNLEYKKDYDLGDKVIYRNDDLGIIMENRIVEISEVFENGEQSLEVTFGDDYILKKVREIV